MWKLFRRRSKGWMPFATYYKLRDRELRRNPERLEEEQKQAREWSLQVAERNSERIRAGSFDKERDNAEQL